MASFQPLTEQQYNSAVKAGFSHDQIVQNEIRRKQEATPEPGFIQSMAQGIAKPFLKAGTGLFQFGEDVGTGLKAGYQSLTGNSQGAQQTIQQSNQQAGKQADFGYFGKVNTPGFNEQGQPLSTGQTLKDAIGTGAEIGSYAIGGSGAKAVGEQTLKGAVKQGAVQGLKYGAGAGALQGFGGSMQDQNSGVGDVVGNTVGGAVTGGALGAGIGELGGALGSKLTAEGRANANARDLQKIASDTADPMNKQNAIEAFKQTGRTTAEGKALGVQKTGLFGKYQATPSPGDIQRATDVQEFVKPGKPLQSIANLNRASADIAENQVKPFLEANPRTFNINTLKARLNSQEIPLSIKTDAVQQRAYDLVRQKMVEVADQNPKTMAGLWDSRKQFDQIIQKEFGKMAFDDPRGVAVRQAIQNVRRGVNSFISDETGDGTFSGLMQKLNHMYEARDNIATNNYKLINSTGFKRLYKSNPGLFKVLGFVGAEEFVRRGIVKPVLGQ